MTGITWRDTMSMSKERALEIASIPAAGAIPTVALGLTVAKAGPWEANLTEPTVGLKLMLHPQLVAMAVLTGAKRVRGGWGWDVKTIATNYERIFVLMEAMNPAYFQAEGGVYQPGAATSYVQSVMYGRILTGFRNFIPGSKRYAIVKSFQGRLNDVLASTTDEAYRQPATANVIVTDTGMKINPRFIYTHPLAYTNDIKQPSVYGDEKVHPTSYPTLTVYRAGKLISGLPELVPVIERRAGTLEQIVKVADRYVSLDMEGDEKKIKLGRLRITNVDGSTECDISELPSKTADIGAKQTALGLHVADALRMAIAVPASMKGLYRYQNEFVGAAQASGAGLVNASEVGLGKTIMWVGAARAKAEAIGEGYRAVLVCQADKRADWTTEIGIYFPKAQVQSLYTSSKADRSIEWLTAIDPAHRILICSYDVCRRIATQMGEVQLHDLGVDEADVLWSNKAARSKALWDLRERSERAIPMSGTPYDRNFRQLGALVAFARNDPTLQNRIATTMQKMKRGVDQDKASMVVGPFMFRRTKEETKDQIDASIPNVDFDVVPIKPTMAEAELATAARTKLVELYQRLLDLLEDDGSVSDESKTEIIQARGRVLSGITLARLACSSPEALQGSEAFGSALLRGAGLVDAAIKSGNTKLNTVIEALDQAVSQGGAALVFTDFSTVADIWGRDMAAAGLRVATLTGKVAPRKREQAHAAYNNGDIDVLVQSKVGTRGLNLQTRTSHIVHADLPWTPAPLLQRHGRADRIGAGMDQIDVWVPILTGTIEDRVAATLTGRLGAFTALDADRDGFTSSERYRLLKSLAGAVDLNEGNASGGMLDLCRVVLDI